MVIFLFFVLICMTLKFNANNINNNSNNNLLITKKNVILGVIINYNWKKIAPFFISFKEARFKNCDCVMFVEGLSQNTINKIESFNVKIIKIKRTIKARVINYRHKLYEEFLRNNTDKYRLVLSIDVRDSFFQKDIFEYYKNIKSFLSLSLEDGYLSHPINKLWVTKAFGFNVYNAIKNERIICGGTILGSLDKFIEFSSIIWKIMNQSNNSREKWIDQAVINYLIYYKKLFVNDTILRNENKDSPFLTIGISKPESFMFDLEDNILNIKGKIPAVIHQYDRHKKILIKVLKKFSNNLTEENGDKNQIGYKNYNNNIYLTKNLFLKLYFIFLLYISILLIILLYKLEKKNSLNKKKKNLKYDLIKLEK